MHNKIRRYFISLLVALPFLTSFLPIDSSKVVASFQSPEGIQFVSYSNVWDEHKLINLYKELIKNKHGKEMKKLQQVKIFGEQLSNSNSKGSYHALTKTITLYQGDKYTEPAEYRETLSHEYGHHFAYHYFPTHHFPFSDWQSKRGIDVTKLRWDAFWNYQDNHHAFYPQEIFADDYVLLYGATNEVKRSYVYSNEAFYTRTEHENQEVPNVLENRKLLTYLEEKSGIKIDKNRLVKSPRLVDWDESKLTYNITKKPNVAYRLNIQSHSSKTSENLEIYVITTEKQDQIEFTLNLVDQNNLANSDFVTANIDVVDLSTSIGFETNEQRLKING